ncbi:hypothetical protein GA0116948_10658 [Chitinophaga costaii]|uniref:Uncharacterized protein n=1 Tax=Chitinophaga costaii TaxID=1335309 RepID=A0A1C4DR15_9BACT|nr:hypothetical protein GA0116948_10658 [Chitinophaga costaii]
MLQHFLEGFRYWAVVLFISRPIFTSLRVSLTVSFGNTAGIKHPNDANSPPFKFPLPSFSDQLPDQILPE